MKKDILQVVAYTQVFGLSIYGTKYTNIDCGKDNLKSYFVDKKGWSISRLTKIVRLLSREGVFNSEKSDVGGLYSMSLMRKHSLLVMESIEFTNENIRL